MKRTPDKISKDLPPAGYLTRSRRISLLKNPSLDKSVSAAEETIQDDVIVENPPGSSEFFLKGFVYTGNLNYENNQNLIEDMKLSGFKRQLSQEVTDLYYNPNFIQESDDSESGPLSNVCIICALNEPFYYPHYLVCLLWLGETPNIVSGSRKKYGMYKNSEDREKLALSMLSKIEYKENEFYYPDFTLKDGVNTYSMLYQMGSSAVILMPEHMGYLNRFRNRQLRNANDISNFLAIPKSNIIEYGNEMIYFSNEANLMNGLPEIDLKKGGMYQLKKTRKRKSKNFKKTRRSKKKYKPHRKKSFINKD
jgi:hypothetical protein